LKTIITIEPITQISTNPASFQDIAGLIR